MHINMKTIWSGFVGLTLLISGCSTEQYPSVSDSNGSSQPKREAQAAMPSKTVTSADNLIQLTIPSHWRNVANAELPEAWSLVVGTTDNQTNVSFNTIRKTDAPQLTADLHAKAALNAGTSPFQDANIVEQNVSTTINGYPAVMHRVEGTTLGHALVAMTYSIETPGHYHGVMVLTPANAFETHQSDIESVLQSFKVIEESAALVPHFLPSLY